MVFKRNKKYQEFLKSNFDIETLIFGKNYDITYPTNTRRVLTEKLPSEGDELFEIYVSKIDGSHIYRVNDDSTCRMLFQRRVTEQIQNRENIRNNTCNIGFSPSEQKWYGWSHRAIFGFGIGSHVKIGDSGFRASNIEEFVKQTELWNTADDYRDNVQSKHHTRNNIEGVLTTWTVKSAKEQGSSFNEYPKIFGKGEWTAMTLEDAKQMAKDFARSVS